MAYIDLARHMLRQTVRDLPISANGLWGTRLTYPLCGHTTLWHIVWPMVNTEGWAAAGGSFRRSAPYFTADPRYHSIVRPSPSSNDVLATKPNTVVARDVSSILRGCPSGFVASHTMRPLKPVSFAMSPTRSLIEMSCPAPTLTGSAPS